MNSLQAITRLTKKKYTPPGLALIALILLGLAPLFVSSYGIVLMSSVIMYIVLSVSWTLFSGATGYISLASAAFFGVGIYVSAFLGDIFPLPMLMIIGGISSFILALIVGAITLRLRGVYFTIFTFGLVELLKHLILYLEINLAGTRGRFVVSFDHETVFYALLATMALALVVAYMVKRSRFGMALRSIGDSEDTAMHIGINVTLVKVLAFSISAFAVGAVGAAMATRWTYIDPGIAFNMLMSFMPVLMAIFGGMHKILGPVIGATVFAYLEELLITRFPYQYMLIFGIIMVVAILFLPNGLIGLAQKFRKKKKGAGENHANT